HKYQNVDSPYNTYKYRGLPPGPINLPSIAMIDAVLNFSVHDYLYFSAKEDFSGYHHFARSFREHLRNAKRYQKALNQIRIYR
ncbi:MAG: endolytic transglycosylase MltG, partial [Bacteroidota bacterium]